MKKRWQIISIVLCMALLLGACGQGSSHAKEENRPEDKQTEEKKTESQAEAEEEKEEEEEVPEYQAKLDAVSPSAYHKVAGITLEAGTYISVIGKSASGQYWEQVKKGAEQAAKDLNEQLGYKGKDEIKVTYSGPSEDNNVDEQVNILDEELARYPAALSIAIADAQACDVQFDLAAENDIPVVAFDSDSDYPGLQASVSTDNANTSAEAADHLAENLGEAGKVLIFAEDSKSMSIQERINGFTQQMKKQHTNIEVKGIYCLDQMDEMREGIAEEEDGVNPEDIPDEELIGHILEDHPEIQGVYATDGEALKLALSGLEKQGLENVSVVGYDGDEEEIQALKDGKVDGLIVQNPFGMGYASVIASARAALFLGNEAWVNTGYKWVTQENIDSDEIQEWLY